MTDDQQVRRRRELLGPTLSKIKLPQDRTLAHLSNGELVRIGKALGMKGVSPENGYSANAQVWADHLNALAVAAGEKAIAEFMKGAA